MGLISAVKGEREIEARKLGRMEKLPGRICDVNTDSCSNPATQ
jgi:hypothetical protein